MRAPNQFNFAIRQNNCAANGRCPVCGERTDPQIPYAIFIDTPRGPVAVCDTCARDHAPHLEAALLCLFRHDPKADPQTESEWAEVSQLTAARVAAAGVNDPF